MRLSRRGLFLVMATMCSAMMLVVAPKALAGDTVCVGALTGAHDNVVVPAGAVCTISAATIKGNVKVFGSLNVFPPTTIGGSIDGEPGHGFVRLFGGLIVVVGNVQIKGSPSSEAAGYLAGTQIGGDFQYEGNMGTLVATGGTIGGNAKAEKNRGGGAFTVNTIRGNLECKENVPPITEFGNVIGGNDKCPE
jgi:hypothetical protein